MRKNYFTKLVNYMRKIYNIDRFIDRLKDDRVNPNYKTSQVILLLLLGFLLRIKSMNELTAAKRLITDGSSVYPKIVDAVVYEALVYNSQ